MSSAYPQELNAFGPTWVSLYEFAKEELRDPVEARFLIEHISGRRADQWVSVINSDGIKATDKQADAVAFSVRRRLNGEPLQYVLGSWSFMGLEMIVDDRVLIPRPETEELVELALGAIPADARVLDLGTGSGAIAISIAHFNSTSKLHAVDASTDALEVAKKNCAAHKLHRRINFMAGSWFEPLSDSLRGAFDLIVTNPPYVTEGEREELDSSVVDWEPESALFAGVDGLDDLRVIIKQATQWLKPGGVFMTELAPAQAATVVALCKKHGFAEANSVNDITARPRFVVATMPGADTLEPVRSFNAL